MEVLFKLLSFWVRGRIHFCTFWCLWRSFVVSVIFGHIQQCSGLTPSPAFRTLLADLGDHVGSWGSNLSWPQARSYSLSYLSESWRLFLCFDSYLVPLLSKLKLHSCYVVIFLFFTFSSPLKFLISMGVRIIKDNFFISRSLKWQL